MGGTTLVVAADFLLVDDYLFTLLTTASFESLPLRRLELLAWRVFEDCCEEAL